jgi:transglutaminase-like putative cysteine protease
VLLLLVLAVVAVVAVHVATRGAQRPVPAEVRYADAPSGRSPAISSSARKLATSAAALRALLESSPTARRGETRSEPMSVLHARVEAAADELTDQLARDRDRLRDLGAERALTRLTTIERRTKSAVSALDAALDGRSGRAALRALRRLSPEPAASSTSSDLAFRTADRRPGAPKLAARIAPAYHGADPAQPSPLPREPSDEDRSAAPEGELTAAIRDRAGTLEDDPIRIYEWVRNEIRYEPYLGIRKGAAGTLFERSGNDADQAALLVALLRAAGVPARYVHGTARLPIERAANWLGLDTGAGDVAGAAADILAVAGIPARRVVSDGAVRYADFDHVWVEAHVARSAYRGVDEGTGTGAWAPLDPSVKSNRFTRPVDIGDVLRPAVAGLQEDLADGIEVGTDASAAFAPSAELRGSVESAVETAGAALSQRAGDELSVGDALGSHEIEREEVRYLPASLPFRELEVDAEWRSVPSELMARVSVEVAGAEPSAARSARIDPELESSSGYEADTWELFGERLTLGYAPATDDDAAVIDAYHGLLSTPAYGAALVPVLRIDGRVVARGREPVPAGWFQALVITYDEPGQPAAIVRNPAQAGAISAIVVDAGSVSRKRVREDAARLGDLGPGTTEQNAMTDARAGSLLSSFGDVYFARNDGMDDMLAQALGVHRQRQLSGAVTATALRTDYVMSFPVAIGFGGLSIDVDQDVQSVVAKDGDQGRARNYMAQSGVHASYSEGRGFEGALGGRPASSVHVFQEAVRQGIPLHLVAAANVDDALAAIEAPRSVETEIRRAVAVGRLVTVPRRPVQIGGFRGTAYVIEDVETGAAEYRLSTGTNGGLMDGLTGKAAEENLTAMFQNIAMLKSWVADSGKGMSIQGDEVFAPSSPDGGYCDVFVDKEGAAPVLMAILVAVDIYRKTDATKNPVTGAFSIVLGQLLPPFKTYTDGWAQLPMITHQALLYDLLYTLSRQIAMSCIG